VGETPAIETQDLSKTYVVGLVRRRAQPALCGVTLRVQRGEVFGLLGSNGAGKTTFVKLLLGMVRPTSGQARLLGWLVPSQEARRRLGYLPENLRVPAHLTGLTALTFYGQLSHLSAREARRRAWPLLEQLGLAARANDSVRTYSKGMLQRLGLAQAVLHEPEVVFLDEPTDGMDPVARAQVRTFLKELQRRGTTIFLNSHLLQEVEMLCDRVAILDRGRLRQVSSLVEITTALPGSSMDGRANAVAGSDATQVVERELELILQGSHAAIEQVLADRPCEMTFHDGVTRVHLRVRDQAAVDDLVDRLRQAGVSILCLMPRRRSLEQAYLQIVRESAAP
jgi:ABC-2 type transport system ATP-binding protein